MYEVIYVCKTTNWQLYIIICNCIYIVVISYGWNNNIAVRIVAGWNLNVFTSSWLDRQGEFVFTIHVRCDPFRHVSVLLLLSMAWSDAVGGGLAEGRGAGHIFTGVTRAREKLLYAGGVSFTVDWCFESYMIVTHPIDLCYDEKSQDISVSTIWDRSFTEKRSGKNLHTRFSTCYFARFC